MADPEFVFTLHFSAEGRYDEMLRDLATTVLRHAGCAESSVARTADAIASEVAAGCRGHGECDLRFRAHGGAIEVDVSQSGRSLYRTERRLPDG